MILDKFVDHKASEGISYSHQSGIVSTSWTQEEIMDLFRMTLKLTRQLPAVFLETVSITVPITT
jgi:hypothetical protein